MRIQPRTSFRPLPACGAMLLALVILVVTAPAPAAAVLADAPARVSLDPMRQEAAGAATLDRILEDLSTYDGGIDSAAVWKLRDYVHARKDDPAGRAECEARLLQFLESGATPAAKMAASRHLRLIGGDTAVPALTAMLARDASADMALYVLQQIPGGAAESALLQAVGTTRGPTKQAVVAALGQRRVTAAVPVLVPLLGQPAVGVAAATALGRIGGDAAAAALAGAYRGAQGDIRTAVAAAIMTCAEATLAAKNGSAALALYETLLPDAAPGQPDPGAATLPPALRRAAAMGRIMASGSAARDVALGMLGGTDPDMQAAAVASVADVFRADAIEPVCALLPRLSETLQVQVLAVLSRYPGDRVRPAVLRAAGTSQPPVRLAAMKALATTGDASVVPFLADAAASASGAEQTAARLALGALRGRAVDDAIRALLDMEPPEAVQGELLLAIGSRRAFPAKPVVAGSLTSSSQAIRVQALKALRAIGTPSDVPAVLDLLLESADDSERAEAEKTAADLARTALNADGRSRAVKARLDAEDDPGARVRLMGLFPLIGDPSSLPVLRAALHESDPDIVDAAVRGLTSWPTGDAREDILRLARDTRNETHRLLAIGALVRSVGLDRYRDPQAAVSDLRLAAELSWRPEEHRLVLGALVQFPCREALDLAAGFLQEPATRAEAEAAVGAITKRLPKEAIRK